MPKLGSMVLETPMLQIVNFVKELNRQLLVSGGVLKLKSIAIKAPRLEIANFIKEFD